MVTDPVSITDSDGITRWYLDDTLQVLHRLDGPAVIRPNGSREEWYLNGLLHREDGPAVYGKGTKIKYYHKGVLHREDGPAVIGSHGLQKWYRYGICTRTGGPAVIYPDGREEWRDVTGSCYKRLPARPK